MTTPVYRPVPPPPPPRGGTRLATALVLVGLLLMLVSPASFFLMHLAFSANRAEDSHVGTTASGGTVHVPRRMTVRVTADSWDRRGDLRNLRGDCTVTGPYGEVEFRSVGRITPGTDSSTDTLGEFTAADEGDYNIRCDSYSLVELEDKVRGDRNGLRAISAMLGSFVLAAVLGLLGLVLVIFGAMRAGRARSGR